MQLWFELVVLQSAVLANQMEYCTTSYLIKTGGVITLPLFWLLQFQHEWSSVLQDYVIIITAL